jgi:hypothetical protein
MAKQAGTAKITGTIGDITFYKSQDGLMAKAKSEISGKRIATDPAYARTRENNSEFGRACKTGKVIRTAFNNVLSKAADNRMISRLVKAVMKAQKADDVSDRGERNIITGDASLLEKFDFNVRSPLGSVLKAQFLADVDRVTGEATVTVEEFIPETNISAPDGATHFKLFSTAAAINFESESFLKASATTPEIELGLVPQAGINLVQQLPANSEDHLIIVLGIEFYQKFNGRFYPMNNGGSNAITIARVDMP